MSRQSRRLRAVSSLAIYGLAAPVLADPLTVTGTQSTPSATATASNNSAGDITVNSGASISVSAGTPATINSDNLLTNNGTITSSASTGTTGLLIDGTGGRSNARLLNNGVISITGTTTGGTGNIGVLVSGGPITGSITAGTAGSISVTGDAGIGVSLAAPFTGNVGLRSVSVAGTGSTIVSVTAPLTGSLSLVGSSVNSGGGGYGINIAAPVSGSITNGGTMTVGTSSTVNSSGATVPGLIPIAGARISANVAGGFLNDRYYTDSTGAVVPTASVDTTIDTLVTGSIFTTGSAPALSIGTDATATQAITIGAGADGYAVDNRGTIRTVAGNAGLATTALQIGGGGATTTLTGGIGNQSTGIIAASSTDAGVTAIAILAGGKVPVIANLGTIDAGAGQTAASGSVALGTGGSANAITVVAGGTLTSIVNGGTISASAIGAGKTATAILDQSSSLTNITNTGTINATSTTGTGGATRAIDLTGSTATVLVSNSGTINGDIVLGNGATTLQLTGGTITGAVGFGSGSSNLVMSGASMLGGTITSAAPIAVTLGDTAALSLVSGPATIASINASGSSVLTVPGRGAAAALTVTGAASFTGNSVIALSLQSLAQQQQVTIISAAGGITTDHLATLVNGSVTPFLFTASSPTLTATTLSIDLTRKSGADLGLGVGQTNLYNASLTALANSPAESAAIANLPDQASVAAAYRQITPPSFGHAAIRVATAFADSGFGAASDRMTALVGTRQKGSGNLGIWAQELGNFDNQKAGNEENGYYANTFGIAGGIDKPVLGLDAAGLGILSSWTAVKQRIGAGYADVPVNITTVGLQPYLSWSHQWLFVQASAIAAKIEYKSARTLTIGSFTDDVSASWSGSQFGAGATIGARFKLGRLQVTPTNSIYWTQLHQNGYTEQGGGAFALAVDGHSDTIVNNTTRLSVAYLLPFQDGDLLAELHGSWVQAVKATNTPTVAHFLTTGDSLTMPLDTEQNHKYGYGGGFGYLQDGLKLQLGYDRRQDVTYRSQQVALTASMAF